MQEGRMKKKEISAPITIISRVIVEATLGEELRKKNRHGTKMVDVSVFYYEAKNEKTKENGKRSTAICRMRQDKSIHWEYKECPIEVQEAVEDMFPKEKMISYIENLK